MVLVDAQTDDMPIVYVNPAFEALTAYSKKDIIGKDPRFLHQEDHQQAGLDKVREAIRDGHSTTVTIRNYRRNIQQNFSNTDKKELQWLQYLSIGLGIIWFLVLFSNSVVIFSGVVIFVLFIGF